MRKYSELKEKINIDVIKENNEGLSYLTHYLHHTKNGVSHYYKQNAENFVKNSVSEPLFPEYLNLRFDVPFPPNKKNDFKFIDLFAGIGGFRIAMQNLGGNCVFSSEIDNYAKKTYDTNFGEVPFGDITKIDENDVPEHDVLCAGFPCQAFSIAGKRKGFPLQSLTQRVA